MNFKKKTIEFFYITVLVFVSFFVNYFFGHQGLMPLDDLQNFNSGYRVLRGDFPFVDYYSITGPLLDIWQAFFFNILGVSWSSFVVHSSFLNCLYSLSIYLFLKELRFNIFNIFCYCLSAGILMYPPAGTPTVEHHSLIISTMGLIFFMIGLKNDNKFYLILSPFLFCVAFFIKQVPTAYFIIFAAFLYFFQIYKKIDISSFKIITLSSVFSLLLILAFFFSHQVSLKILYNQYIVIAMNLGESRFNQINFLSIYENISKLFFLLFLIIPSFYIFCKNKENKSFSFLLGISFVICFYENHSNNQPITFALLPIFLSVLHYDLLSDKKQSKFTEYFFYLIISYTFFRILRYEIFYLWIFLLIFLFITFNKFFTKKIINLNFLLIIYLAISTSLYFEKYIKIRAWDDLKKNDLLNSFDGNEIDIKFNKLNWKTIYFEDPEKEKKLIKELLIYLKSLDEDYNYIMMTDYQIYNAILNKKDFSPVKYWFVGATYPEKNNLNRNRFNIFFKKKIIENNIQEIIIDGTAKFNEQELNEFAWLKKCLIKKTSYYFNNPNVKIYKIKKNCIN